MRVKNKNLILISDESGDIGPSYLTNASKNYLVVSFLTIQDNFEAIVRIAHKSSIKAFGHGLKEWKKLQYKNDFDKLNNFIITFFNKIKENNLLFLLSVVIVDKNSICYQRERKKDLKQIKYYTKDSYRIILNRIMPFVNNLHFQVKHKIIFNVNWYIDNNSKEFIKDLNDTLSTVKKFNINISNPNFISKTDIRKNIVYSIRLADVLGGIINKIYENYQFYCASCVATDCFNYLNCYNKLMPAWKIIKNNLSQNLGYKKQTIWQWRGLLISPPITRTNNIRFFGQDEFFK